MSAIDIVSLVSVGLAFLASLSFVVAYRVLTSGHWRDTPHGVHLMVFSEACVAIFFYVVVSASGLIPESLRPWFRTAIFLTMAGLFLWRLLLLLRDQRVPVEDDDEADYRNGWPPKA